ncbi:prepilin peptidase [bacterium]|nr:prepilin peptidase [bacterium]
MVAALVILVVAFLCLGSFLSCMAYRLVHPEHPQSTRSCCPQCHKAIAWFDLIPVVSWTVLHGQCRHCKKPISWLYPFIELLTAVIFIALFYKIPMHYWLGYGIFFAALIISIRTDLETMLISRWVTIALIPIGVLFSFLGLLPISVLNSILGALLGYGILFGITKLFYLLTGKLGMGEGDFDLLAMIGSFTGIGGMWFSLMIGSVLGSIIGLFFVLISKNKNMSQPIPFGPFLAGGSILFSLFSAFFLRLFL